MIELYGSTSPNVVKICIALEELEFPYRAIPVDILGGAHLEPGFETISPTRRVPVIIDQNGPDNMPYRVFESGAILVYLADKGGRFISWGGIRRYDEIQWLMVQMAGIGPMFGQFFHYLRIAPKGNDYSYARYKAHVVQLAEVIEVRLAESPYLGGPDYSIVDMAHFPWLRSLGTFLGIDLATAYPAIARWVAEVAARPGVIRGSEAAQALAASLTQFGDAKPETLGRIFGWESAAS